MVSGFFFFFCWGCHWSKSDLTDQWRIGAGFLPFIYFYFFIIWFSWTHVPIEISLVSSGHMPVRPTCLPQGSDMASKTCPLSPDLFRLSKDCLIHAIVSYPCFFFFKRTLYSLKILQKLRSHPHAASSFTPSPGFHLSPLLPSIGPL